MDDRQKKIQGLKAFQGLDETNLQVISKKIIDRHYKKGMLVFLEGEPGDQIYFVYSGKLKVTVSSEDGQEKIIQVVQSGDVVGEVVAFDQGVYPISAEVLVDAEIGVLDIKEVHALIQEYPALALNLLKLMSRRLRQLQRQIKNLALKDAYGRLASRLWKLAHDHGIPCEQGVKIGVALTHQDLANFIGTSRETVSRILREFEKAQVIAISRQQVIILNENKLREWM